MAKKKRLFSAFALLCAAILLFLFINQRKGRLTGPESVSDRSSVHNGGAGETAANASARAQADTIPPRPAMDTVQGGRQQRRGRKSLRETAGSVRHDPAAAARLAETAAPDSAPVRLENGSDSTADLIDICGNDTVAPWVYTDPAGGLHHKSLSVKLFATKPGAIEWKTGEDSLWMAYDGEAIPIRKTTTLFLQAVDSCGNAMPPREEYYELRPEDTTTYCPPDMEHVQVGKTSFCIDRFEWPNRKGQVPRTYISVYHAMDTCFTYGKRLCTSDEWRIACAGPYGWKYPYGTTYELYACVTNDTTVRPSGGRPECRGYFGIYDMSGNCAEWTGTKSSANIHFYNVEGGFWESGPQSGCFDVRYSYFPQNRHNPVGFRCCRDALPVGPYNGVK